MICLIAFIIFGILAIFSATHRPLAKEAFDCVFRRVTLRKCKTNLDQRIKGDIVAKTMKRSLGFARFIHKRFTILSWIFTILLIISLVYSGIAIHDWIVYGNCNGPTDENGFCILNEVAGVNNQDCTNCADTCIINGTCDTNCNCTTAGCVTQE